MSVPNLFAAPHHCTADEYRALSGIQDAGDLAQWRAYDDAEERTADQRWTRIYELALVRGDAPGMAAALAQIQDRALAQELAYRDIVQTPPERDAP